LFEADNKKLVGESTHAFRGWRDERPAVEVLDRQFRMRRSIADVVSHAFYADVLQTDEKVDERPRIPWLADLFFQSERFDRDVIWIDTTDDTLFRSNPHELLNVDQAQLAAKIVKRVMSLVDARAPRAGEHPHVVALSPYRRQNEAIENALRMLGVTDPSRVVHTVDSFQGQEADVVVLSLVRTAPPSSGPKHSRSALHRYGFLVAPERVNVMLSRARELLIVIGDYSFYSEAARVERRDDPGSLLDLSFWERTCDAVARVGRVVPYGEIPLELRIGKGEGS
jgi:superfamily I DNA and/or RNA helicase